MSRWLLAVMLAVPGVALAQAGMGTGGTRSGNYAGGVSSINMPRDPANAGRLQNSGTSPLAGQFDAGLKQSSQDPDAARASGAIRPEEGVQARGHLRVPR